MLISTELLDLIDTINPFSVIMYLQNKDWKEFITAQPGVKIFQKVINDSFYQVDIPTDRTFRDYKRAMYLAIKDIATAYNQNIETSIQELLYPVADVLYFHIQQDNTLEGCLDLESAMSFYSHIRKLLETTAYTFENSKETPNITLKDIKSFLSHCKFGQTEVGSYILPLICPIMASIDGEQRPMTLFDSRDSTLSSITRFITCKIMDSLSLLRENITSLCSDQSSSSLDISSEFVDHVKGLGIKRKNTSITISIKPDPVVSQKIPHVHSVSFNTDFYAPLDAYSRALRASRRKQNCISGKICKISHIPTIDNNQRILITIQDEDEKKYGVETSVTNAENLLRAMIQQTTIIAENIKPGSKGRYLSDKITVEDLTN